MKGVSWLLANREDDLSRKYSNGVSIPDYVGRLLHTPSNVS